jgi:hypothetical protein
MPVVGAVLLESSTLDITRPLLLRPWMVRMRPDELAERV